MHIPGLVIKRGILMLTKEEFQQMLEEQKRSKPLEDEALEQFVKKPEESNLSRKLDKIISSVNFILLLL